MHADLNATTPTMVVKYVVQNAEHLDMARVARRLAAVYFMPVPDIKPTAFIAERAKNSPALTLDIIQKCVLASSSAPIILTELSGGNKVPAIKLIRQAYVLGLKEAKDVADRLQNELYIRNKTKTPYYSNDFEFSDEMQLAFDEIMERIDG